MILERRFADSYNRLMKMIKRDLLKNLGEKGIQISNINVVLGENKLKLKMSMREWEISAFKGSLWRLPLNVFQFKFLNNNYKNNSILPLQIL